MAYKLINTLSISASVSASNELFADQFESYDSLTIFSPASFNAPHLDGNMCQICLEVPM